MKKIIVSATLIMLCLAANAQKKKVKVAESNIGGITCLVENEINMLSKDTTTSVILSFKNAKYSYISDWSSIVFLMEYHKYDLKDFVDDLKQAEKEMDIKQSIEWERDLYTLHIYDFNKGKLYIQEPKKRSAGYTTINKKQVGKLIEWLDKNAIIKDVKNGIQVRIKEALG